MDMYTLVKSTRVCARKKKKTRNSMAAYIDLANCVSFQPVSLPG